MKSLITVLWLAFSIVAVAQVSTDTEVNTSSKLGEIRPGYYVIAKPFEVTMTVNVWGEVPLQGLYVVPVQTDIVQIISYSGGPKEKSDLEDILIYRATDSKKSNAQRTMMRVNVVDIVEGEKRPLVLQPGDMIVVKKIPDALTWLDIFAITTTITSLLTLIISVIALSK
ncbi:MAG: hypothetical protein HYV29_04960 [Ignavibacteriales bacterium]|nr:hypothetical protein [Ignavibacteriales bacterium]